MRGGCGWIVRGRDVGEIDFPGCQRGNQDIVALVLHLMLRGGTNRLASLEDLSGRIFPMVVRRGYCRLEKEEATE